MKKSSLIIAIILGMVTISCTSRTKIASMKEAYTPILILNDSVQAINYKHVKNGKADVTILTIAYTYNGEQRTATTTDYATAYATLVDSTKTDVAIGYFLKKKDIR